MERLRVQMLTRELPTLDETKTKKGGKMLSRQKRRLREEGLESVTVETPPTTLGD
jgi:hypothetical protein